MKPQKIISVLTGLLVFLLAIAAFYLSFNALKDLAANNGIVQSSAWVFPLIVDGAMIVFSLSILRNNLYSEKAVIPWLMVGGFTAASIVFNVLHSNANILAGVISAVAPIALFLSFETLMRQIKNEVIRQSNIESLDKVLEKIRNAQSKFSQTLNDGNAELEKLDQKILERSQVLENINQEIKELRKEKRELDKLPEKIEKPLSKSDRLDFMLETFRQDPTKQPDYFSNLFEVSGATIYNYLGELETSGKIERNNGTVKVTYG